jgi:hypothetical protein
MNTENRSSSISPKHQCMLEAPMCSSIPFFSVSDTCAGENNTPRHRSGPTKGPSAFSASISVPRYTARPGAPAGRRPAYRPGPPALRGGPTRRPGTAAPAGHAAATGQCEATENLRRFRGSGLPGLYRQPLFVHGEILWPV